MRDFIRNHIRSQGIAEEDAVEQWVCRNCVGDPLCSHKWRVLYLARRCIGCEKEVNEATDACNIAKQCRTALSLGFELAAEASLNPMSLSDAIAQAIRCTAPAISNAIAELLIRPPESTKLPLPDSMMFFDPGQKYRPRQEGIAEHAQAMKKWDGLELNLMHGRRFFNDTVKVFFESLLHEALLARDVKTETQQAIVRELPTGFRLFRARIAHDADMLKQFEKKPELELGPPPPSRAGSNRMSPVGVTLLYLAEHANTSIAEVRPSIGDQIMVAEFQTSRPLTILDLPTFGKRMLHERLSLFDLCYEERQLNRLILSMIHDNIAKPVKSADTGYLLTQAFAEFVRYESPQRFDGIAFRSVQNASGTNYVLFSTSAVPDGTQLSVSDFGLQSAAHNVRVVSVTALDYSVSPVWPYSIQLI